MSGKNTRPADAAARDQAIFANGSVLVQAPAGSGKTTLLVQRYLRLLAVADAPECILALTFTRRAAEEMRRRVLRALRGARLADCPPDLQESTWSLAVAARRRMQDLALDIERQPARLRIETIDAFNAWLAARLPISGGAGSGFQVLADAGPCYEEAARRALAYEESDDFGAAVDRVLMLDDQRWRRLRDLIADMLPARDRWLPLLAGRLQVTAALDAAQLARVRQHFDEDLQLLVLRALAPAPEILGAETVELLSRLMSGAAQRLAAKRPALSAWLGTPEVLRAEPSDLARWRGMSELLLTGQGELRKRLTKAEGFPAGCADKPAMSDLLTRLDRDPAARQFLVDVRALPSPEYNDEQWARVREVAQVLVLAAAQLEQVFREQGAADFPAVSMAALRALGSDEAPTDLGLRLDFRLQHILLDEFQDTSSAQLELVRLLTAGWQRGEARSVFGVGDPMQSIYGFRQAEVRAFLDLAEDGIGEIEFDVQRLRSNFRSARTLVEWINARFAIIMPRADDRDRGAIAFRPSEAAVADAADGAGVELRGFAARSLESAAVADMIAAQAGQHPEWRIAVLVRARTHAREIAAVLSSRGIAFRAVDIEPLQDRSIVRDVIMLTRALLHLADRTAWFALLRAPWAGLTLEDLLLISQGAPLIWEALCDDTVLARLNEAGQARCRRVRTTLEAAFRVRAHSSLARWIERTWLMLGAASCAASAQELELAAAAFARLRVLERRGLPDAAELAQSFADLYADHGAAANVEIMTIHKAKGLEFDMVVIPALDRHVPQSHGQLLLSHQFARSGRDGMVMAARPTVGGEDDRLFEFLRRQQRDAAGLEATRLLYVACTRAKQQLRLTATVKGSPRAGSLLAVLWPSIGRQIAIEGQAADGSIESDSAPRGGPLGRLPEGWRHRAELGPVAPNAAAPPARREETPVFDWAGETARRVGILVHAELQALNPEIADERAIRARAGHFRRWLQQHGVPADRLDHAAERVVAALIAVLRDPRGRWILQGNRRDDVREHALSGEWQGEVARVVFDRSFIDDAGVRWVIDYKTSQHLGSGLDEFLDREVERYRPQLDRYAKLAQRLGAQPVRLGLYFPLMGAWREWSS